MSGSIRAAAVLAAALLLSPSSHPTAAGVLPTPEASFDNGRLQDVVTGVTVDPAMETHVRFVAGASTTLGVTLRPTKEGGASGLGLELKDVTGNVLGFSGTEFDKSKLGKDEVKWKKAPLPGLAEYVLAVRVTTAGSWTLTLGGKTATNKVDERSAADLDVEDNTSVEFEAVTGDAVKFKLAPDGNSKFGGQALRVERPDASSLDVPQEGKGTVVIDADGTHKLVFTNVGKAVGAWRAKLTVKPHKVLKRNGLVSAAQTGLVPVVKKPDPKKGVHLDTALELTISGRDFQPGADVRLIRNGREDILATDIDVHSETELTCRLDLDTRDRDGGKNSVGKWKLGVFNVPLYGVPGDRTTLDATSPLASVKKSFQSVSSGSVKLPRGVKKETEVWELLFNDEFEKDLNRMGFRPWRPENTADVAVVETARAAVKAYVTAYLRDLLRLNETNGGVENSSVPVSVVVDEVTAVAGMPGVDYNRIEIGGEWLAGDPLAPGDALEWGFAPLDAGNANREDLTLFEADGTTRRGHGVRTRVLDPGRGDASVSWITATQPLIDRPLRSTDRKYLNGSFDPQRGATTEPGNLTQAQRYAVIATQLERVSREIAAIVAHHIGRAMGLATDGDGPMESPTNGGKMWKERPDLAFASNDLDTLQNAAVPHALPGKSDALRVVFLPLADQQEQDLRNEVTGSPWADTGSTFRAKWNYVGGRCNAQPADYNVRYAVGSQKPLNLTLSFQKLEGVPPVCTGNGTCSSIASVYCRILVFRVDVTDRVRNTVSRHVHRLKVTPDDALSGVPAALRPAAQRCRDDVRNAP